MTLAEPNVDEVDELDVEAVDVDELDVDATTELDEPAPDVEAGSAFGIGSTAFGIGTTELDEPCNQLCHMCSVYAEALPAAICASRAQYLNRIPLLSHTLSRVEAACDVHWQV